MCHTYVPHDRAPLTPPWYRWDAAGILGWWTCDATVMAGCHRAGRTIGGDRDKRLPSCCGPGGTGAYSKGWPRLQRYGLLVMT